MQNASAIIKIIVFVIATTIGAKISLDIGTVPTSAQTLVVLTFACFLNWKIAAAGMLTYLTLGAVGLPVFVGSESGIEKLTGLTAGYLLGFLVAAVYVAYFSKKRSSYTFVKYLNLHLEGIVIILVLGVGYLAIELGIEAALVVGLYPFWKGIIIKTFLGALICWLWAKFVVPSEKKELY